VVGIQWKEEGAAAKKQFRVTEGDLMRTLLSRKPFLSLETSFGCFSRNFGHIVK